MSTNIVLDHIRKGMKSARQQIKEEEHLVRVLNAFMEVEKEVKSSNGTKSDSRKD